MQSSNKESRVDKTNRHVPVLLDETIRELRLEAGMTVVDGTLGNAGHAEVIAQAIGPKGTLIGIEADPLAITEAKKILSKSLATTIPVNDNFANLKTVVNNQGLSEVHAILLDLGLRRGSLEDTGRGFSFQKLTEPLDMRFNPSDPTLVTAAEIINSFGETTLADLFYHLADERRSRQYASAIVRARSEKPLKTVGDLVSVIEQATPAKAGRPGRSPATKVFQALRMTVNQELEVLDRAITDTISILSSGGRLVIITFHSIEDRLVKQVFKKLASDKIVVIDPTKVIKPTQEEIKNNKLSRSATLRAITKL